MTYIICKKPLASTGDGVHFEAWSRSYNAFTGNYTLVEKGADGVMRQKDGNKLPATWVTLAAAQYRLNTLTEYERNMRRHTQFTIEQFSKE